MYNPTSEGGLVIPLKSPEVDSSTHDRPEQQANAQQSHENTYEQPQEYTYHPLDQQGMFDQASFYNNGQGNDPSGDFVPAIKQEDFEDSLDHLFAQQLEEYHNTHGDEDLASEDGDDGRKNYAQGPLWLRTHMLRRNKKSNKTSRPSIFLLGNNQQGFKKRHNRSMSPGQKALIEERISMERPNRTLFVRNIDVSAILHTLLTSRGPDSVELTNITHGAFLYPLLLQKEVWH